MYITIIYSVITFLIFFIGLVNSQTPFESGYDHGCDDATLNDESQQYINQHGKGPTHHTTEFMDGYKRGYHDCYEPSVKESNDVGTSADDMDPTQISTSSKNTFNIQANVINSSFFFGILILAFIILIAILIKRRSKRKVKERKGFSETVRQNVLRKQDHKCAHCKRLLNVVDYDHKNGNRSDNRERNCQALCPNCHAIKTRKEQGKR